MSRFKIAVLGIAIALSLGELFGVTGLGLIEPHWGGPRWGDKTLHQWQSQLKCGDVAQRREAARALAAMHSYVCPGWNCRGHNPPRDWVGILDDPQALPILVEALYDADSEVRNSIAFAVAGCGPYAAAAVPELETLLTDPQTTDAALFAFKAIGPGAYEALPLVAAKLHDEDPSIRLAAARAIWAIAHDSVAVDTCCELMELKCHPIRNHVLQFMSDRSGPHPPSVVPKVCRLIRGELLKKNRSREEESLAFDCVNLLAAIGPAAAQEAVPLVMAIFDQDDGISENCLLALGCMGNAAREAVPWIVDWLQNGRPPKDSYMHPGRYFSQRAAAVRALGDIGSDSAVPALVEALSFNENFDVRFAAVESLGKLGPASQPGVPRLLPSLTSDGHFSSYVALALWRICKHPNAVPVLIADGKMHRNHIALSALGEVGESAQAAIPFLRSLVSEQHEINNVWAAEALWRVARDPAAITWLEQLVAAKCRNSAEAAGALWRIDRRPDARAFLIESHYRAVLHDEAERVWQSLRADSDSDPRAIP